MEQAGTNPLLTTIIRRQKALENDVSFLKREKSDHNNQIETLAVEVHEIHVELVELRQTVSREIQRVDKKIDTLEKKMNRGFAEVHVKLDLIINALAL
jgi:predicted  nucleic acid-binding Zn-ribbon protein